MILYSWLSKSFLLFEFDILMVVSCLGLNLVWESNFYNQVFSKQNCVWCFAIVGSFTQKFHTLSDFLESKLFFFNSGLFLNSWIQLYDFSHRFKFACELQKLHVKLTYHCKHFYIFQMMFYVLVFKICFLMRFICTA